MTQLNMPLNDTAESLALLQAWRDADAIRPLDLAFAKYLLAMGEASKSHIEPASVVLAAISSLYLSDGHVCLDLNKLFESPEHFIQIAKEHRASTMSLSDVLETSSLQQCLSALKRCEAVAQNPNQQAPLALKGSRLYLTRFYHYELTIAQGIKRRLPVLSDMRQADDHANAVLKQAITALFKGQSSATTASQIHACALAARSQFAIITGGPGTGKTTTVVKLLAALQSIAGCEHRDIDGSSKSPRKLKIALAAPTGKAAARLNQSIRASVLKLPFADLPGKVNEHDIPQNVTTLHRLLGSRGASREFIHNQQNPLPIDVLVIDEASMVDVSLMAAVINALSPDARLVLLGDKDQLASVDAGAVLGQLAQKAHEKQYSASTAKYLLEVTGIASKQVLEREIKVSDKPVQADLFGSDNESLDDTSTHSADPLLQNIAMLNHSFRFDGQSGIGNLSKMVNSGRIDAGLMADFKNAKLLDSIYLLGDIKSAGFKQNKQELSEADKQSVHLFLEHIASGSPDRFKNNGQGRVLGEHKIEPPIAYRAYLQMLWQAENALDESASEQQYNDLAQDVIACFERFQVLCAMRSGPYGVEALNIMIQEALIPTSMLAEQGSFYQGRPVLVTRNDYNLGLTNGDIGIVIWRWVKDARGKLQYAARVAFASDQADGAIRWFSPARLQSIETVFAMTVHKSQGSEFEHTCLVLPERQNAVVTKELVYTAITRAKSWLSIVAPNEEVLRDAIKNPISRESGLMV